MRKQKGFSLIELLIVVAIILIIAAIAVPNLLRSRMAANESSAGGGLRTISSANVTYATTYGVGFSPDLPSLGCPVGGCTLANADSTEADLIDEVLANAIGPAGAGPAKSGYVFEYTPEVAAPATDDQNNSYAVIAMPSSANVTGVSHFCVDQTNVIRRENPGVTLVPAASGAGAVICDPLFLPLGN